jgi:hypothetical protein
MTVKPGQILRVSAWVYNATGVSITTPIGVNWFTSTGAFISGDYSAVALSSVSAWAEVVVVGTAPATAATARVYPIVVWSSIPSGAVYLDQVSVTTLEPIGSTLSRTASGGVDVPNGGIAAAKFASTIEPVGLVTATANASGELVIAKAQSSVYNTTDGKLYRWDASTSRYKRPMSGADVKEQLAIDKLTAGEISAGAIGTTQLSTSEILVGGGTGKPPRFKVVDSSGNMIAFIGDYGDGFVGGYFQRLRVAASYASTQRIEATLLGVSIENVPISVAGSTFNVAINTADGLKITDTSQAATLQANSYSFIASWPTYAVKTSVSPGYVTAQSTTYADSYAQVKAPIGAYGGTFEAKYPSASTITVEANSAYNGVVSNRTGSLISFASGGYCSIGEYRISGTSNPVIDSSRNIRWHTYYTENLNLGSLTATRWVAAYDASGTYLGKIPIIP